MTPAKKRKAMTPSNLCFRAAMLLVLAGMLWGLQMAITADSDEAARL
jgi:hypothetical protein